MSYNRKQYFHKNKEGKLMPCRNPDRCPFKNHTLKDDPNYYYTSGEAFRKDVAAIEAFKSEVNRGIGALKVRGDLMEQRSDMRELVKDVENKRLASQDVHFNVSLVSTVRGDRGERRFIVQRHNWVVGNPPQKVPGWGFWIDNPENSNNYYSTANPIMTELEAKTFKQAVVANTVKHFREIFSDKEEADRQSRLYVSNFFNEIATMETEERGALKASQIGFSFFNDSTASEVVAKADYKGTSFRGKHLSEVLESPRYSYEMPDVTVIVHDKDNSTGSSWTLNSSNGVWNLIKVDEKGKTSVESDMSDSMEVSEALYRFVKEKTGYSDLEASKARNYAFNLVEEVNEAVAIHQSRIIEKLQKESTDPSDLKFREMYYESIGLPDPDLEARKGSKLSGLLGKLFG